MIKLPDIEAFNKLRATSGAFSVWMIQRGNPEHTNNPLEYCVQRWEVLGSVAKPCEFCGVVESLEVARTYAPRGTRPTPVDWPEQPHIVEVLIPEEPAP